MNVYLLNLIVLGQTLLLALPPGLCCVDLSRKLKPAVAASCCFRSSEAAQPVSPCEHGPAGPASNCCCRQDTVLAVKATNVRPDDFGFSLAAAALVPETLSFAALDAGTIVSVAPTGPPLRILHCVWRC